MRASGVSAASRTPTMRMAASGRAAIRWRVWRAERMERRMSTKRLTISPMASRMPVQPERSSSLRAELAKE